MPYRRFPRGNKERLNALDKLYNKSRTTPDAELAFSLINKGRLEILYPAFQDILADTSSALVNQGASTKQKTAVTKKIKMYIDHFVKVFNLGIKRGKFRESDRPFYGLDISSKNIPILRKETEILTMAAQIINGENLRTAAGGVPMTNPSAAEIEVLYNEAKTLTAAQSTFKDEYDRKQEETAAKAAEVDELIKDIWEEIYFYFRKDRQSSRRRKAREYGVYYYYNPSEKEEEPEPEAPVL